MNRRKLVTSEEEEKYDREDKLIYGEMEDKAETMEEDRRIWLWIKANRHCQYYENMALMKTRKTVWTMKKAEDNWKTNSNSTSIYANMVSGCGYVKAEEEEEALLMTLFNGRATRDVKTISVIINMEEMKAWA